MPNLTNYIPLIILFTILSLFNTKKRVLMCLLNLEIITLGLIVITIALYFNQNMHERINIVILLVMRARGASLGLACLVKTLRSEGRDKLKSLNVSKG